MLISNTLKIIIFILYLINSGYSYATINIEGKTSSKISATVRKKDEIFVDLTNSQIQLESQNYANNLYSADIGLKVKSTEKNFSVYMSIPLIISNQQNPQIVFQNIAVKMGLVGSENTQPLSTAHATDFTLTNWDQVYYYSSYNIKITAQAPTNNKNTKGLYSGTLSLVFQPVVT